MPNILASGYGGVIHSIAFDTTALSLKETSSVSGEGVGKAPTWLLRHKDNLLYSGDEFAPEHGALSAWTVDQDTAKLTLVSQAPCNGEGPVSFIVSPDQKHLYVACYGGGTLDSVALTEEGHFVNDVKQDETFPFVGTGPHTERQEAPHPHQVELDPTGQYLFICDLGSDQVRVFSTGDELTQLDGTPILPGSGPRHLLFVPPTTTTSPPSSDSPISSQTRVYLVNELTNTVSIYEVEYPPSADSPHPLTLKVLQQDISIVPTDQPTKDWTGAELAILNGDRLVISNRAPDDPLPTDETDLLAIFKLDADGLIDKVEGPTFKPVGARGLRHFSVSPCGKWLALAAQKTNEVIVYEVSKEGEELLKEVARVKDIKEPTCAIWA